MCEAIAPSRLVAAGGNALSANSRNDRAAKEQFTSFADQLIDAGWALRNTMPGDYSINAQIVALEDSLLELDESVARLWRAMTDVEMPPPPVPWGIERAS